MWDWRSNVVERELGLVPRHFLQPTDYPQLVLRLWHYHRCCGVIDLQQLTNRCWASSGSGAITIDLQWNKIWVRCCGITGRQYCRTWAQPGIAVSSQTRMQRTRKWFRGCDIITDPRELESEDAVSTCSKGLPVSGTLTTMLIPLRHGKNLQAPHTKATFLVQESHPGPSYCEAREPLKRHVWKMMSISSLLMLHLPLDWFWRPNHLQDSEWVSGWLCSSSQWMVDLSPT